MNDNNDAFAQMAATLDGHQITDDEGKISEETPSVEEEATQEENTVLDPAPAEKPLESEEVAPATTEDDENQLAADETGKRYVPESRLKKETARFREKERENADLKRQLQSQSNRQTPELPVSQPLPPADRTEAVEVELLKTTLPQFDPESTEYDKVLDEMGAEIYKANPGITRLTAAKRALKRAGELTKSSAAIKAEARQVKTIQSDQGITSRVEKRSDNALDVSKMDDKQLEELLRSTGQW